MQKETKRTWSRKKKEGRKHSVCFVSYGSTRQGDSLHHGGAQAQGEGAHEEAGLCGGRGGGGAADDGVGDLTEGDKGEAAHDELPAAKAVRVEAEEELEQPFGQVVGERDVGHRVRVDGAPCGRVAAAGLGPGLNGMLAGVVEFRGVIEWWRGRKKRGK